MYTFAVPVSLNRKRPSDVRALINARQRRNYYRRSFQTEELAIVPVPHTHILCSAHVAHGKDRDHVLREIEINRQGMGIEEFTSAVFDPSTHHHWHIYNPGFQVESQFVDVFAYIERVLKTKMRFLVTYSIVQRKEGREVRTMCFIVSVDQDYDSITLNRLRALLINSCAPITKAYYQHMRLTVVFRNIRVIYADLNMPHCPVIHTLDTSIVDSNRRIVL